MNSIELIALIACALSVFSLSQAAPSAMTDEAVSQQNEVALDDLVQRERELLDALRARSMEEDQPMEKRAQTFVRFGKRAQTFVRFGKRAQTFVRFGRSLPEQM